MKAKSKKTRGEILTITLPAGYETFIFSRSASEVGVRFIVRKKDREYNTVTLDDSKKKLLRLRKNMKRHYGVSNYGHFSDALIAACAK